VADLSPLRGTRAAVPWCECRPQRDAYVLGTLEKLQDHGKPAGDFQKASDLSSSPSQPG